MAVYEYSARDEAGHTLNGVYEGIDSTSALREELARIGYSLLRAKKKKAFDSTKSIKISPSEVMTFAFRFAGMCTAGLSIIQCLETLEKQAESDSLKCVISDIKKNIEVGASLTEAFEKYRYIFSDFFLGMIEAGESSGKLAESLEIVAKHLEKQADIKNRLKGAFIYPIIVLVSCFIAVTILVMFVVPVFSKIYHQLGVPLPGPTQMLVVLSVILRNFWPVLIMIVFSMPFLVKYIRKSSYIKTKWDYLKFQLPLFGKLNRAVAVSNYIRSFAMLITTGVPLLRALQISGLIAHNERITFISDDLQKSTQAGVSLAESLGHHDLFPPLITQLTDSGEQAGQLSQMLNKGCDFLDKDIDRMINSLMTKLEPILTMVMGVVIGLILMAVYLPMFDYMAHLK